MSQLPRHYICTFRDCKIESSARLQLPLSRRRISSSHNERLHLHRRWPLGTMLRLLLAPPYSSHGKFPASLPCTDLLPPEACGWPNSAFLSAAAVPLPLEPNLGEGRTSYELICFQPFGRLLWHRWKFDRIIQPRRLPMSSLIRHFVNELLGLFLMRQECMEKLVHRVIFVATLNVLITPPIGLRCHLQYM